MEVDVLIVGAGPAGSTTARFCAGEGIDVLMIDRRSEIGNPVQCGEFLPLEKEMYDIFPRSMALDELFSVDPSVIAGRVNAVDMISPGGRGYRCPFEGVTLDRRKFDKWLVKLALESGARLETGASLLTIKDGVARTTIGDIRAKVIVGADGPRSRTAWSAGMTRVEECFPAISCKADGSFEEIIKMYFGGIAPEGYAWIIPKSKGANVGIGFNQWRLKEKPSAVFERFVKEHGIEYHDVTMGLVPVSGPVRSTVSGSVVLVGDAAGTVMATSGGGIPTAMIGGRFAGRAIKEHLLRGKALSDYDQQWRQAMYAPLMNALRTKRMSDWIRSSDALLGAAMFCVGRRGLNRAIRCKRMFLVA